MPAQDTYRILAVAATPFFGDRGGHIHIYEPIQAMQALGHEVTLVTYHIGRDMPGLDIRRIPNVPWYGKTDAGPSYHKPYLALLMLYKTWRVARQIRPDIIHAHGWDSLWVAWWIKKLLGIPFIFDMQGSFTGEITEHGYVRMGGLYFRFLSWLERISLNAAPVVVTSSSQIANESRRRFDLSPAHMLTILDGVDTDDLSPENFPPDPELRASLNLPDKPIIIFMGLLKPYQGVDDMFEAICTMVNELKFTNFHFLILGFPDEDRYEATAESLGIADHMTFVGRVSYEQIGRYLALADLAIAPKISMTEGDGKIYCYMAMGLPVVAYDRPASREILQELGIYVPYHQPDKLALTLRDTLGNKEQLKQRGEENRERAVLAYSWRGVAERILHAYEQAFERSHRDGERSRRAEAGGIVRRFRRQSWRYFRLLMGLLGIVILANIVDISQVSGALTDARIIYLFPAWGLMLLSTGVKTLRWQVLLNQNGVVVSFRRLLGTYLIGAFYSQFLPGSSAGGDAMRMAESSIDTGRTIDSVASVLVERAIGLISIVGTASLILLIVEPEGIPLVFEIIIYTLALLGTSALLVLRFGMFIGSITAILDRLGMQGVSKNLHALSDALRGELGDIRILLVMVVLSLLANGLSMTAFYLALMAITDPVPYLAFISLVALIVTIEVIPLTPGSLGIREGAYVFFLGYLAIAEPTALSIGLLIRLITWTQALIGGMILMQRGLSRQTPKPKASGGD